MIQEHRYSLTRVCLRRGELTLPRSLTGLFDSDGPVTVSDSLTGTELQLDLQGQRVLSGLGAFFEEHELDVNDALLIRRAEDGTISKIGRASCRERGEVTVVGRRRTSKEQAGK